MDFLERMVREIREDVETRARTNPVDVRATGRKRMSLVRAIEEAPHVPLIAEIKWSSPSLGRIRNEGNARELARAMVRGGAVALSVLAERRYFGGHPGLVREVRDGVEVPVLYKSVVVHEYQVYEAASVGADAILLMVSVLGGETARFADLSHSLGMETIAEIGREEEVELAISSGARIIGINNRDFRTLTVDINRTVELARYVPDDFLLISESGIGTPEDVRKVLSAGADAVLVGTAIMKAEDVEEKVRSLVRAR